SGICRKRDDAADTASRSIWICKDQCGEVFEQDAGTGDGRTVSHLSVVSDIAGGTERAGEPTAPLGQARIGWLAECESVMAENLRRDDALIGMQDAFGGGDKGIRILSKS